MCVMCAVIMIANVRAGSLVTCTFWCTTDELELGMQGFFLCKCVLIFAFSLSVWASHLGQTKRLSLFLLIASVYILISSSFIFMLPDPLDCISSLYGWRPYSNLITNVVFVSTFRYRPCFVHLGADPSRRSHHVIFHVKV